MKFLNKLDLLVMFSKHPKLQNVDIFSDFFLSEKQNKKQKPNLKWKKGERKKRRKEKNEKRKKKKKEKKRKKKQKAKQNKTGCFPYCTSYIWILTGVGQWG